MSASQPAIVTIRPKLDDTDLVRRRELSSWPCGMESAASIRHSMSDNYLIPPPRSYARSISESRLRGLHLPTDDGHHQSVVIPDMPLILSNHPYPHAARDQRPPPTKRRKHSQITEELSIEHEPIVIASVDSAPLQAAPPIPVRIGTEHNEAVGEIDLIVFSMPDKVVVKTQQLRRLGDNKETRVTSVRTKRTSSLNECSLHEEVVFALEAKTLKDAATSNVCSDEVNSELLPSDQPVEVSATIASWPAVYEEIIFNVEAKLRNVSVGEEHQASTNFHDIDGYRSVCVESVIIFEIKAKTIEAPSPTLHLNDVEERVTDMNTKLRQVVNNEEQLQPSIDGIEIYGSNPCTVHVDRVIIFEIEAKTLETLLLSLTSNDNLNAEGKVTCEEAAKCTASTVNSAAPCPLKSTPTKQVNDSQGEEKSNSSTSCVIVYDIEARCRHTGKQRLSFSERVEANPRQSGVIIDKDNSLIDKRCRPKSSGDIESTFHTPVKLTAFRPTHEAGTSVSSDTDSPSLDQVTYTLEAKVCRSRQETEVNPKEAGHVISDNSQVAEICVTKSSMSVTNAIHPYTHTDNAIYDDVTNPFVYDTNPRSKNSTQSKMIASGQKPENKFVFSTDDNCSDINTYTTRASTDSKFKHRPGAALTLTPSGDQSQSNTKSFSTPAVDVCPTSGSVSDASSEGFSSDEDDDEHLHRADSDSDDGFVVPYHEETNIEYQNYSAVLNNGLDGYRAAHPDNIDGVVWQNFGVENVIYVKGPRGLEFCIDGGVGCQHGDRPITIKRLYKGASRQTRQALHAGDEILAVNNFYLNNVSRYTAWHYLKSLPCGPVNITLKRLYTSF